MYWWCLPLQFLIKMKVVFQNYCLQMFSPVAKYYKTFLDIIYAISGVFPYDFD
jgi:hypothetical protein